MKKYSDPTTRNVRPKGDESIVWDDMRIVPGAFEFAGSSDPTLEDWQPTGSGATLQVYKFRKNDQVFASIQIPHDYRIGSDLYFHIHWTPCDRGNEESGALVGWKIDYTIADIGGNFGATATVDLSSACSGVDDKHEITDDVMVDGSGITNVSAMIMLRIYRSDTGADDTWAGSTAPQSPALLEFDIHYQKDTIGSLERLSKGL